MGGGNIQEFCKEFPYYELNDLKINRRDSGQEFYAFVWEEVGLGTFAD